MPTWRSSKLLGGFDVLWLERDGRHQVDHVAVTRPGQRAGEGLLVDRGRHPAASQGLGGSTAGAPSMLKSGASLGLRGAARAACWRSTGDRVPPPLTSASAARERGQSSSLSATSERGAAHLGRGDAISRARLTSAKQAAVEAAARASSSFVGSWRPRPRSHGQGHQESNSVEAPMIHGATTRCSHDVDATAKPGLLRSEGDEI